MFKNAILAIKTAELANISINSIKRGLEKFSGVEGRMQFLGEKKGIIFYNDNNSTTPNSTIVGLKSLKEKYSKRRIFLIGGGTDKGFEYQELANFIEKNIAHTLLFEASGTEKMIKSFSKGFDKFDVIDFMKDIPKKLTGKIHKGDIIILSPACSSFGKQFKNEYDRSEQFIKFFKNFIY